MFIAHFNAECFTIKLLSKKLNLIKNNFQLILDCQRRDMLLLKVSILFSFLQLIFSWEDSSDLLLNIKDGQILGRYITSETGKIIKAFMGIPYAQPPIGNLRFKAPQKVQPWEGLKRTQFDGNVCVQNFSPVPRPPGPFGDEDCLFLNVYVPAEISEKMSVMVWIHGGGWAFGDGGLVNNGPEYLLENEIILVSINYRLGPLGFLSTENGDAQGNYALKDQQMALQWVQENIEYFGGNKSSVTIWGGNNEIQTIFTTSITHTYAIVRICGLKYIHTQSYVFLCMSE